MKNSFYNHLIEVEKLTVELDKLDLSSEEKHHLASLIDASLYHTILNAILSQLNEKDKRVFVQHITEGNKEKIWRFLNAKIDHIENKIKDAADDLKDDFLKDIKKTHNQ